MKKRWLTFRNTLRVMWLTSSKVVKTLVVMAVLVALSILVFSPDRQLWLVICGGLMLASLLSVYAIYRLLLKDPMK
jgi:hypothetical protein